VTTESLADVLARHNESDCTCPHEWKCPGRLYGISMMDCWVRLWDQSDCPHHGWRSKQPRKINEVGQ